MKFGIHARGSQIRYFILPETWLHGDFEALNLLFLVKRLRICCGMHPCSRRRAAVPAVVFMALVARQGREEVMVKKHRQF